MQDFPGGLLVKKPLCNAGDMGLIPGRGTKIPHATEQLSPRATAETRRSQIFKKNINAPLFIVAVYTTVGHGDNLDVHQQSGQRCGTYARWNTIQPQKEQNDAIDSNMDATRAYHTE